MKNIILKCLVGFCVLVIAIIGIFMLYDLFVNNKPADQSITDFIETNVDIDVGLDMQAEEALKAYKETLTQPMTSEEENVFIAKYLYDKLKEEITDIAIKNVKVSKEDVKSYMEKTKSVLYRVITVKKDDGTTFELKIRNKPDQLKDAEVGDRILQGEVIKVDSNISAEDNYKDCEDIVKEIKLLQYINSYVEDYIKNR